jgi:hypothetical protein
MSSKSKKYTAEVIEIDAQNASAASSADQPRRPSARFTQRMDSVGHIPADDPAARYLFLDRRSARRRAGRKARLRRLRDISLTFIFGMAGAWLVWSIPGFEPLRQQNRMIAALEFQNFNINQLQRQLAQSQARTADLTKLAEINRDLIDQGEGLRRSMASQILKLNELNTQLRTDLDASREKLGEMATLLAGNAEFTRQQVDRVNRFSTRLSRFESELKSGQSSTRSELTSIRNSLARLQSDEVTRTELLELKSRVERLAGHVWQEVGRLDGRIVRASAENPATTTK